MCERFACMRSPGGFLLHRTLEDWHMWVTQQVQAFQRASSAVEGRNGATGATPSQPARVTEAAVQGVDHPA